MASNPLLTKVLRETRWVVCNFAGTLAPHNDDPAEMRVPAAVVEGLRDVAQHIRCAVLTGNSCDVVQAQFDFPLDYIVGVNGDEVMVTGKRLWRDKTGRLARAPEAVAYVERYRKRLEGLGAVVRVQGRAAGIIQWGHLSGEQARDVSALAHELAKKAWDGLGLYAWELTPTAIAIRPTKILPGFAVDQLIAHAGPSVTAVVMIGDNNADDYDRLRQLKVDPASPVREVVCFGVLHPGRPQPDLGKADEPIDGTEGVIALLGEIANCLR